MQVEPQKKRGRPRGSSVTKVSLPTIPTTNPKVLIGQARYIGVVETPYLQATPEERYVAMQRFVRNSRQILQERFPDSENLEKSVYEHLVNMSEDELVRINSGIVRRRRLEPIVRETGVGELLAMREAEADEDEVPPVVMDGDTQVFHEGGTYLPDNPDPYKRDGVTVGPIRERERPPHEDLVGDRVPQTLEDLYGRWPIVTDTNYYLRIVRTAPKKYQGVDATGLVATVRGQKVTEAQIQRHFGGKEYEVTLFGPDPRGRLDSEGEPVVKALTDPIKIVVPALPPNLAALPQETMQQFNTSPNPMNPFGPIPVAPTTAADAHIIKANAAYFADITKLQQAESERRLAASEKVTTGVMSFMSESQKLQMTQAKEDAARREKILEDQIKDLKSQLELAKTNTSAVAAEVAKSKDESHKGLMEFVAKMGPDKEAEIRRLSDYYTQQVEVLRRSHDDQIKAMRDRHDGDLRRADERVRDTESKYQHMLEQERGQSRQMLESERSQWAQREKELREQNDKQLTAERQMTQQRIDDMKERHASELRQMEKAHERELRTLGEANMVKTTVSDQTHKMSLQQAEQRVNDLQSQIEELKAELEEAKDIPAQLEKMEHTASILGYEKKDAHEPKTPLDRFLSTAGAGVSQLLGSANEWLPSMMAQREAARASAQARALPPAQRVQRVSPMQQPPQQAPQPQQAAPGGAQRVVRRQTGAQWAEQGVRIQPPPEPQEREPLGFQAPNPTPAPQAAAAPTPSQPPPPPEVAVVPVSEEQGRESPFPPKFSHYFSDEALVGFLMQAEQAINTSVYPGSFADLMIGQFPEGAERLVSNFTADEVVSAVAAMEGSETSALLRRDGKKWMQKLFSELRKGLDARAKSAQVT